MVHIAIDIGASSGRLVTGILNNEKLEIQEIHRFENMFLENDGTLYWDIDKLLQEILIGLEKAKKLGYNNCTIGIDTWAVDYVLLDDNGKRVKEVVSYRDHRTFHSIEKLTADIPKEDIYQITGIQFLPFNTIFQLYEEELDVKEKTNKVLMVPDYINYRLTGKMVTEKTNASTTQLLNVVTRQFDQSLLEAVDMKNEQFPDLIEPGTVLGKLKNEWFPDFDLPECQLHAVASHDTASAVVGTPGLGENWAYLSNGTWSLLGIETNQPIINNLAFEENYTNEWGVFNTTRFLKNIMGMWIIQEIRKQIPDNPSYESIVKEAEKVPPFQQFINFNDNRFLNPINMIDEIQQYCEETEQTIPQTMGELASCVYSNLAIIYSNAIENLEKITKKKLDTIHIVGGGAHNELLNQLTADISNKTVYAGPTEATAIGNILMQCITTKKISNLDESRQLIRDSFPIKEYSPSNVERDSIIEEFNQTILLIESDRYS